MQGTQKEECLADLEDSLLKILHVTSLCLVNWCHTDINDRIYM